LQNLKGGSNIDLDERQGAPLTLALIILFNIQNNKKSGLI